MLEVAEADLKLGFVDVKAPQACRKSLAELASLYPRRCSDGGSGHSSMQRSATAPGVVSEKFCKRKQRRLRLGSCAVRRKISDSG